jgi:hypothetical protein
MANDQDITIWDCPECSTGKLVKRTNRKTGDTWLVIGIIPIGNIFASIVRIWAVDNNSLPMWAIAIRLVLTMVQVTGLGMFFVTQSKWYKRKWGKNGLTWDKVLAWWERKKPYPFKPKLPNRYSIIKKGRV